MSQFEQNYRLRWQSDTSELEPTVDALERIEALLFQQGKTAKQAAQVVTEAVQQQKVANQQQLADYRAGLQQQTNALKAEADQQTLVVKGEQARQTAAVKAELNQQTAAVRAEMNQQTATVRAELNQQTAAVRSELAQQNAALRGHTSGIGEAYGALKNMIIGAFGVQEVYQFAQSVVDAKSKVDLFQNALTQMVGSRAEANQIMAELQKIAVSSPFKVDQLFEVTTKLKAMGVATAELIPTINMLGNMAAVVGNEKLPFIAKAFVDIQNRGVLFRQEWNQMTNAGIDLMSLLAKSMDKPREAVVKMAEAHEISFAQVKKAMMESTEAGGLYYGQMNIASQALAGQTSNLADKFFFAKARLGDYYENGLKNAITWTSKFVDVLLGNGQAIQRTEAWLEAATAAYVTYRLAVNATATAKVRATEAEAASTAATAANAAATTASSAATSTFSGALTTLWTTVARNPLGALITAVMAVVTATQLWQAITISTQEAMGDQEQGLLREKTLLEATANVALTAAQNSGLRRQAIATIVQQYPEYFKGLNTETISNDQLRQVLAKINLNYAQRIELAQKAYMVDQGLETQNKLFAKQLDLLNQVRERAPEFGYLVDKAGGSAKTFLEEIKKLDPATRDLFYESMQGMNAWDKTVYAATNLFKGQWKGVTGSLAQTVIDLEENGKAIEGSLKSRVELEKKYDLDSKNLTLTHNAAMLSIGKDHDNNRKQQKAFTDAELSAMDVREKRSYYNETLAQFDRLEKAEKEHANKITILKGDTDAQVQAKREAAAQKLEAIDQKYEQKRTEFRQQYVAALMTSVQSEQDVQREAIEAIEALEVTTTKDRKEREKQRLKDEKEANAERKKDVKELQQSINETERETAQIRKQTLKEEVQGRKEAFGMIMDIIGQQGGVLGSIAQIAKKTFDDWDVLSGKSVETAKQALVDSKQLYATSMTSLFEIYKTGDALQIKSQEEVVAKNKKAVAENEKNVEETSSASLNAMLGWAGMAFQVLTAIADAFNAAEKAKWKATAEAASRTREILNEFYDSARKQNREYVDDLIKYTEMGYDQQIELIKNFYAQEKETAAYQRRTDDYLAFVQKMAEIRASDLDDEDKLRQSIDEIQRFRQTKGLQERIEQLEIEKAELTELHELRLKQIDEVYNAEKDRINKEIDSAKDAFEQKKDLIEAERDKKKEVIEAELDALKDSYDKQRDLAQQQYDQEVTRINERYDAEKKALQDAYDFKRSLVEQSKADEVEAAGIIDRLRDEVLARYEKTETDKLVAQRDRILATITDESEKARVVNEFAQRIEQVHKDAEDAKLDKSKASTLVSKQLKQEEKDLTEKLKEEETNKIVELETRQKNEITTLKTELKTTLDTYRQDYETKETELKGRIKDLETETKAKIEQLQTELKDTILKYQNQLKDNETQTAYLRRLANTDYANATYEAERNLFNARKEMAITELQIEVAKLRARGGSGGLINELNDYIAQLGGKSFDRNSTYAANGGVRGSGFDSGGNWVEMDTVLNGMRTGDGSYRGEIYVKRPDGSYRKVYLLYNANRPDAIDGYATDGSGKTVNGFFNYADAYDLETGAKYAEGTEYVPLGGNRPGIDTVPAMLTAGERVLTVADNQALGGISNAELVRRVAGYDWLDTQLADLRSSMPDWSIIREAGQLVPVGPINGPLVMGDMADAMHGIHKANSELLDMMERTKNAIEQFKPLSVRIDQAGFAVSEQGKQSTVHHYSNVMNR